MKIEVSLPEAIQAIGPVTICQPGKRSTNIIERQRGGTILVTTQTALQWPQTPPRVPTAKDDRRTADQRIEAAERAEALSVVLAQPHRAGSDDARLAFPLGRFCARMWSRDANFGSAMHEAGVSYATEVRIVKVARGFHVSGCASDAPTGADSADATLGAIEAQRAAIYALERTLERANGLLRDVMPRCPAAMVRLCFDHQEPSPYDEDILRAGLYRLALHYGKWEHRRA